MRYTRGEYKIQMPADALRQREIQEALIADGCRWCSTGDILEPKTFEYLYIVNGRMHYGNLSNEFHKHPGTKIHWSDVLISKKDTYEIY